MLNRGAVPLALTLIALAIFGAWMHWAVLDPWNIGWLLDGNDRGQNSLGLLAYLRGGGPWPSLHDPLLMAPEGIGVALTDSNPLLALLLKPLAWLLPAGVQYTGPWLLACIGLQTMFAWRLLRPRLSEPAALMGTVLLAMSPALLNRHGHMNLCAHWLILWALWLYLDGGRRTAQWIAVIAMAALVHPYLLVMVAAIWASALLRSLVTGGGWRRWILLHALPVACVLVAVPAALGFIVEPLVSTGTYGLFAMPLDALWNPGDARYSAFLPASSAGWFYQFEGFNYLGLGMLGLVVAAVPLARRTEARALVWLAPAFAILTLVAIGPTLIVGGRIVATIDLPRWLVDLLDPVRASGRLFWPVGYVIAWWAIVTVGRLRYGFVLLALALVAQVADLRPMLSAVRATSANADDPRTYHRTLDPRWAGLVASAGAIEFQPAEPYRDMALMEEIAWRAITACRPVPMRWFYASREPAAISARLRADRDAFATGRIDPARLYVMLNASPPPVLAGRATVIDGITIIAPRRPAAPCVNPSSRR